MSAGDVKGGQIDDLEKLGQQAAQQDDFIPADDPPISEEKPRVSVASMVSGLIVIVFNAVADRRGDHWRLKLDESEQLSEAVANVVNEYCPSIELGSLPVLGGVAAVVMVPRLMKEQELIKKAESESEVDQGGDK